MTVLRVTAYECTICECIFAVDIDTHDLGDFCCPNCKSSDILGAGEGEMDIAEG